MPKANGSDRQYNYFKKNMNYMGGYNKSYASDVKKDKHSENNTYFSDSYFQRNHKDMKYAGMG